MRMLYGFLADAVALAACEAPDEPGRETPGSPERSTVFDPLVQTVERARGVQATVDEHDAEQRRRLREAEGQ